MTNVDAVSHRFSLILTFSQILFVYSKLHSDIGYRQGMHEVLAVVYWCTDLDSLDESPARQFPANNHEDLAKNVLSRRHVEHDAFSLYSVLMTNMLSWYDPAMSVSLSSMPSMNGQPSSLVQPVVAKCAHIHELLKKVDFELWRRMEELQIEPQIYGIRWTRLLFSREFPMEDA